MNIKGDDLELSRTPSTVKYILNEDINMTTVELKLNIPDGLAQAATSAGLLKPDAIEGLLREAIRHKAIDEFFAASDKLISDKIPPMSFDEIQSEVNAVRQAKKADRTK